MKILKLIIKQVYFDAIIDGSKTQEFRMVTPTTIRKYFDISKDFIELTNPEQNLPLLHYDALQLYVGYNKNRDSALVKVTNISVRPTKNGYGNYDPILSVNEDGLTEYWYPQEVVFDLGEILEVNRPEK